MKNVLSGSTSAGRRSSPASSRATARSAARSRSRRRTGARSRCWRAIDGVVDDLLADGAAAIGYGVPLNIDRRTGVALRAVNLPLHDVHFPNRARERYGLPAGVENDGNAAALAEWRLGAGRDASNLIMLTLGTGVGGGIVIDDHLYRGWAELGHMRRRRRRPAVPGELPRARASRGARVGARRRPRRRASCTGQAPTRRFSSSGRAAGDAAGDRARSPRSAGCSAPRSARSSTSSTPTSSSSAAASAPPRAISCSSRPGASARAEAIQPADETLRIVEAELGDAAGPDRGRRSSRSRRSTECGDACRSPSARRRSATSAT